MEDISAIQLLKIKLIRNHVNNDEFVWVISNARNKKHIINLMKKLKIDYFNKIGNLIISKLYLDLIEKINFLLNSDIDFNLIEAESIETLYNYAIAMEPYNKVEMINAYHFKVLSYSKSKKIHIDKELEKQINLFYINNKDKLIDLLPQKEQLTIIFKDCYNQTIEEHNASVHSASSISRVFKIYNYEKVKIAKIIKERVIKNVISYYLEGFSIDFSKYETDIISYSPNSNDLCIQLLNLDSGKSIIIYPIVFDIHTGAISEVGSGIGQLRLT